MKKTTALHVGLLAALTLVAALPMFDARAVFGHSALIDIVRLVELDALYDAGAPFSALVPDLYYGYGLPLFRYYAPLSYHLAELFHLAGFSIPTSIKAVYLLAFLLSGLGAYRLFSLLKGPWAGLLGGVLYLLAPYHFVNAYVRSALAETLALSILPWLAASLLLAARGDRRGARVASAGLLTAALVISHNLSALLALPALALLVPIALPRPLPRGWALRTAAALALGVLLSGVYWYPAFAGRNDVWLKASVTEEFFDYRNHFVYPGQLLATSIAFGISDTGPNDGMPFPAGALHLTLAGAALVLGLRRGGHNERRYLVAGLLLTALPLFMTLDASRPLWKALPLLPYVQFPWRFLGLAGLGVAWLGAALPPPSLRGAPPWLPSLLATGAVVVAAIPWIDAQYILFDKPLHLTREGIAGRMSKTTGADDYLPIGVTVLPDSPPVPRFLLRSGKADLLSQRSETLRHEVTIGRGDGAVVECRVFWFPGWEATWNGVPIEILRSRAKGTVIVAIPPGDGTLEVTWSGDPLRRTGGLLSLLGILLCGLVVVDAGRWRSDAA